MENNEDLLTALSEETEIKQPAASDKSFTWDFENENIPEAEIVEEKKQPAANAELKKEEIKKPKVDEKIKRGSARTAVGMLDVLQKSIFTPLISLKYKKKFTEEEINALEQKNIPDAVESELTDEDKALRNKWDRLMKKCNKKLDAIPLIETEKQDMEDAFYLYFDIKEKSLPPEWYLGFAILKSIGDRTIDLMSD